MLAKLLGKKKDQSDEENKEHSELVEKIEKMNLTEMRQYVRNQIKTLPVTEDGLREVALKLVTYLHEDDMDSKKKKAFDLILMIAASLKISVETVEVIQKFVDENSEIINAYDTQYKEIYGSRFKDALALAIVNVTEMTKLHNKMHVLE